MTLEAGELTFDCAVPALMALFWAEALGYRVEDDADPDPDGVFVSDPGSGKPGMFFQRVPEQKVAKNRLHLDLRPSGSMAEEVERLKGLGATVRGFIEEEGNFWTQMRDPEGNEFCVLRGPKDGWSRDEL